MLHLPAVAAVPFLAAPRRQGARRVLTTLLLALTMALGGLVGTVAAAIDVAPAAAATRCGGSVPGGHIRVVVVVDSGVSAANATCLVVAEGTTGAQLWAHRAAVLGTARPRYADSGLLCAFDGYPATGCGTPSGDGYLYWSYWSGNSGSWVYGGGNPHVRRVRDGDIEGWRFVSGPDGGQNPPPRIAPSTALFPPRPAPTTQPPPPPPPSRAPAAGPAPAPTANGASSGGTPSGATPPETAPRDAAGHRATTVDPETGATIDAETGEVVDPADDTAAEGAGATTSSTAGDEVAVTVTELAADTSGADGGSSGGITGAVVAAVLVLGLGAAGVVRARSRR